MIDIVDIIDNLKIKKYMSVEPTNVYSILSVKLFVLFPSSSKNCVHYPYYYCYENYCNYNAG